MHLQMPRAKCCNEEAKMPIAFMCVCECECECVQPTLRWVAMNLDHSLAYQMRSVAQILFGEMQRQQTQTEKDRHR